MPLKKVRVSQKELQRIAGENGSVYSSSSYNDRFDQRLRTHKDNCYGGTAYCAKTQNMMNAEDKLFAITYTNPATISLDLDILTPLRVE
jgi:hypothetical protein